MSEEFEDGNYLVRVRAQVMMRDDHTGGWLPWAGGGLANVCVRKRPLSSEEEIDECKNEYFIIGKKIADQNEYIQEDQYTSLHTDMHASDDSKKTEIVLSCQIRRDFEYNKVMPTFHHWKTQEKRFGLTFQTAADARAFDKGVRIAMEDILGGATILQNMYPDPLDDDVFMTLNLPVDRGMDSLSSSDSSKGNNNGSSRHSAPPLEPHPHYLHRIHYVHRDKPGSELDITPSDKPLSEEKENYSYVQLTEVHEYLYPVVGEHEPTGSLKKRTCEPLAQPPLPRKKSDRPKTSRTRCRHCQEFYIDEENVRGSCEYAPDCIRSGINSVTCISCAECMLYHCMSDAEGDFAQHPCECGTIDENCGRRWAGLAFLSLLVPCLWCYPPLRACHWCCVSCGICGGRHQPAS